MEDQNHPLYLSDREDLNRLMAQKEPGDDDLIDIARLFSRYEDFPGAKDIQMDMLKTLKMWALTKEELFSRTRSIWSKGYRPGGYSDEMLGSSFDTSSDSDV